MKEFIPMLKNCPLFQGMEEGELAGLLGCLGGRPAFVSKHDLIFMEGEPAKYVGIVLSGQAQVIREDYYGNRSIVARIGPGQLFGESFACADVAALPVSVAAAEDSRILLMDCQRMISPCSKACAFHNRMVFNLMKIMAAKNLVFHQKIEVTSKRTTREKLMAYLMLQAKEHQSSHFTIPFDRQELADYLEVDRSGLSAEISKLRSEGILSSHRSTFTLLKH